MRDGIDDLQAHEMLGQQPQCPAAAASRRRRTGQRDEPSFRLAVDFGRLFSPRGSSLQQRQRPLKDRLFTPIFQGLNRALQGFRDATVRPPGSFRTLVAFQQGPRSQDPPGRSPLLMNQPLQSLTLLRQQLQDILLARHKATLLRLTPILRTYLLLAQIQGWTQY